MPATRARIAAAGMAAVALAVLPACDDEDGDGGTTDEELQELEDRGEDLQDELEEEVDAQNEGSNQDGE